MSPRFTVCTPTYNRAGTLRVPFESLVAQSCQDFEWIVMDDGSEDDSGAVLAAIEREAPFPMRVVRRHNRGKFRCVNEAATLANGELFVILDSDDGLLPEALDIFAEEWEQIPEADRGQYIALAGLCVRPDGGPVGTPYPKDRMDASWIDLRARLGVRGEKCEALVTARLREHPYPEVDGERHVPPSFLFLLTTASLRFRCFNRALRVYEPGEGGITQQSVRVRAKNGLGYRDYYRRYIAADVPRRWRFRNGVNYVRFGLHRGVGPVRAWVDAPREAKAEVSAALPVGVVAWLRDRWLLGRGRGR